MLMLPILAQAVEPAGDSAATWTTYLDDLLFAALAALLGFLAFAIRAAKPLLKAWIDAKIGQIENEKLRDRISLIRGQVESAVYGVSQTMVPEIRAAAEDGKITPQEREKLLAMARDQVLDAFDQDFWTEVMDAQGLNEGQLRKWLTSEIEARVFRMKMERGE